MEADDVKYVWAAYRKGSESLVQFEKDFSKEFTADEFREAFHAYLENYEGWWTVIGDTPKGRMPIGFVCGFILGRILFIGGMVWFPWASKRNVLEGALTFLNRIRRDYHAFEFAHERDMGFFNHIQRYGIIRRVGTSYDLYPDGRSAVYETRRPKWQAAS